MLATKAYPFAGRTRWLPASLVRCLLLFLFTTFFYEGLLAGSIPFKSISGTVTDQNSDPVVGASVKVRGKSGGTQTDATGRFTIDADDNDVVEITSVGYLPAEFVVGASLSYDITLEEDLSELEQVVVVGYGTQKKVNLTGSVSQVGGAELTKRPAANVQNLLQGKVTGLQVTQGSGKPGGDGAEMMIRGTGSFGGSAAPLVLIDGIRGDMMTLNPDDIESVSVLKDAASAAIYGARAANGVILVTTKRGKARDLTVSYHGNVQAQQATRLPKLLTNSADYMMYWNQANERAEMPTYFSQATIDAFRNSNDPVRYPNFDWVDHVFRTGMAQNHHLNVSGGTEKTTYNLSLGYLDQDGIMSVYDFKRYNFMLSVDSRVNNWLKFGGLVQFTKRDIMEDNFGDNDYVMSAYSGPNYTPTMTLPDGSIGHVARYSASIGEWTVRNPDALNASGFRKINSYNMRPQLYADVKLTKDLTWYTKGAIDFTNGFNKRFEHAVDNYYFDDGSYAHNNSVWQEGVRDEMTQNYETTLYSTLNYIKTIGDHDINVLAGYNQETNYYRRLYGSRIEFPVNTIPELNAGAALAQSTAGLASEWAIQSFFGRLAYAYKERYLFEANIRRDGTSRIAPENRWGSFPSVSAAWRASEENFMRNITWLDNLKFRASWGKLGNQEIGLYPYQAVLETTSYPFDGLNPAVRLDSLKQRNLKWETTQVLDFGIDLSIRNGLFTLTADWFNKTTYDILAQIPIPAGIGLVAPVINYGKLRNRGWEFEVGHRNRIGEVDYGINFNLTTVKNKVLDIPNTVYNNNGTRIAQVGLPYNSYYLIEWDGIFQSQDDIDRSADHPFAPKPGDLKYKDANGDGVINAEDRVMVNGAYPKFFYGGSLNVSWKGFDLTAFFQGVEGFSHYVGGSHMAWGYTPYTQGSPPTLDFIKNMWTPENPSNTTPAIYQSQYRPNTGTPSTYWLLDASYIRLKNLAVGYTFRNGIPQKLGLNALRVYASGDNLFTITDYPGADPERACATCRFSVYPQVTIYTVGVKASL